MRGFAGLLDWRLGGRLSALLAAGFVTGEAGEALLVPGKPHVPFEKVLVVGLGARGAFDDGAFRAAVDAHRARARGAAREARGGRAAGPGRAGHRRRSRRSR